MKRAWLSEADGPLGREVAGGLQGLGWLVEGAADGADLRVLVLRACDERRAMPEGAGTLIIVAPAGDRLALSALSLETQKLAVAAAPAVRVNAVAVEQGFESELPATIDWLAAAEMVTGQLILLSSAPGPSIPL